MTREFVLEKAELLKLAAVNFYTTPTEHMKPSNYLAPAKNNSSFMNRVKKEGITATDNRTMLHKVTDKIKAMKPRAAGLAGLAGGALLGAGGMALASGKSSNNQQ